MKKFVLISLLIFISLVLISCGNNNSEDVCASHNDADGNGSCDVCNAPVEKPLVPNDGPVTFTVKDQDGAPVSAVLLTFTLRGVLYQTTPITAVSGADGTCSVNIPVGSYNVTVDCDKSEYYLKKSDVKVEATTYTVDIILENVKPSGTESRPYPLSEGNNTYDVASGGVTYFSFSGRTSFACEVTASGIKLEYKGKTYYPDSENRISFKLESVKAGTSESVKIVNTQNQDTRASVSIFALPGSLGNPHLISSLAGEIKNTEAVKNEAVFYSYTPTVSGRLTLTLTSLDTVGAVRLGKDSVALEDGRNEVSFDVTDGEEIIIELCKKGDTDTVISFKITIAD